jgi:hypothetical protein
MSYSVHHVRYTFECDVCGRVEKHDEDDPNFSATEHLHLRAWANVNVEARQLLCCPACTENIRAVVYAVPRAAAKAQADKVKNCEHTYVQRGFVQMCSECGSTKPRN